MLRSFLLFFFVFLVFISYGYADSVTLIVSGQTKGMLEACGCVEVEGGMEARAGFLETLRSENVPFALVDLGEFVDKEQNAINEALGISYLRACRELEYDLALLSPVDLAYGYDYLFRIGKEASVSLLCTNLSSTKEPLWKTAFIKEMGKSKIGILGAVSLVPKLDSKQPDFAISDSRASLAAETKNLRETEGVDAVVLLAFEPPPIVIQWLEKYNGPKIDLVVTQDFGILPKKVKETYIVNTPSKGYAVGKITFDVSKEKGIDAVKYERISLKPDQYKNEKMRNFLTQAYAKMIVDLQLAYEGPFVLQNLSQEKEDFSGYGGADLCRDCHFDQYEQWAETKHATAFYDVINKNRHWMPQCVMCHVTGFGNANGYRSFEKSARLRNVQCETCHGPGQQHADDMGTSAIRRGASKELCAQCHDQKNSPKFEEMFDLYYKKILH
ncbi:MAG: hypothetical protein C4527_28320 [Candidatus Omnitrophota bacterium]|nr:MAG: hypothetical protein C4527_28320 [Candidatus Omnitrophota bacterium]